MQAKQLELVLELTFRRKYIPLEWFTDDISRFTGITWPELCWFIPDFYQI